MQDYYYYYYYYYYYCPNAILVTPAICVCVMQDIFIVDMYTEDMYTVYIYR